MKMTRYFILVFGFCLLVLTGCRTRVTEVFPGYSPDQVWSALKAAAEDPDYQTGDYRQRWHVKENHVWPNEELARIEIYRKLSRELHRSGMSTRRQDQTWMFRITLNAQQPPTVTFTSRRRALRAHVWTEAERYFRDVWGILGGETTLEAVPSELTIEEPTTRPIIDVQEPSTQPELRDDGLVDIDEVLPE